AQAVGEDHGVPTRYEIVVEVAGEHDGLAGPVGGRWRGARDGHVPVDVVMIGYIVEPGVVGARLEYHGHPRGRPGTDHPHLDPVPAAVVVTVHRGLDGEPFPDRLGVVVDRLGAGAG